MWNFKLTGFELTVPNLYLTFYFHESLIKRNLTMKAFHTLNHSVIKKLKKLSSSSLGNRSV